MITALMHVTESMLKKSISEPFDFQHLTHTSQSHAKALQTATKKSHNELVSEFSAMRASQSARKELNGIKAEYIAGGRSLSRQNSFSRNAHTHTTHRRAPSTPSYESELNLSPKSRDAVRASPVGRKSLRTSQSVDNFSRISPRSFSSPSPPLSPPLRRSSRNAFNLPLDAIGKTVSPSNSNLFIAQDGIITQNDISRRASIENYLSPLAQHDPSSVGNAVSTPDDSACILRPQMSSSSIALADVPEEEETSEATRQSMQGLGLTMALAHQQSKTSTQQDPTSDATPKPAEDTELAAQVPQAVNMESRPSSDASIASTTNSSAATQTDTTMTTSFTDNWEDDIDYCYEHAAEADCAFDWDRMSRDEGHRTSESDRVIDELIDSAASNSQQIENDVEYSTSPVTGSHLDLLQSANPQPYVYTYLDPRHIKASSQMRSPLSTSSSTIFASEALTPSEAAPSPNVVRFSRPSDRESGIFPTSPSLLTLQDYERHIAEDSPYLAKNPGEGCEALDSVTDLPFYEPRFPLNKLLGEESSCSSVKSLSKCNSRESLPAFARTRSHETFHGTSSSIGSLPELVHSNQTSGRVSIVDGELSAKFSKASLRVNTADIPSAVTASIAEDVSPLTVTPGSVRNNPTEANTIRRERSVSECPDRVLIPSALEVNKSSSGPSSGSATPNAANKSFAGRMRSASAATTASGMAKKSRASYSLFPAVPTTGPR